ncbi:MAG TPA: hypothetical protein VLD18_00810, partial [Verrucomicrobiae bacterium]|nr:hypothetical protein [Verrucomicrobiae bacterium]
NYEGVVLGNAQDADLAFDLNGNRFFNNLPAGASGAAIAAVNATTVTSAANYSGFIRNNTVVGGGIDNHLVTVLLAGAGQDHLFVENNQINAPNAQFSGLFLQAGETGSGALNASVNVTGNTVSVGALGSHGIVVQSRITSALCAEIANNNSATGGIGLFGLNVRQRDTSTFRLPGFAGPFNSTAAVVAFLQGKNPGTTAGATVATAYSGGAACALPALALPLEFTSDLASQPVEANVRESATSSLSNAVGIGNDEAVLPVTLESFQSVTAANELFLAESLGQESFAPVNIGTLPAGKSITITFLVLIANPLPPGICILSNQGTVTVNGGISILTDDPRTETPFDATVTAVPGPPIATTQPATDITGTTATLHGLINPC